MVLVRQLHGSRSHDLSFASFALAQVDNVTIATPASLLPSRPYKGGYVDFI